MDLITTHVPTIHRSSPVCTIALLHCVGTSSTQGDHQFGGGFVRKNRMTPFPKRQNLTFDDTLHIQTVRGTVCTHVHFRVTRWNLTIFTNVRVQTYNFHIVDLLPLDCLICSNSFRSTPVQGISNIYWKIIHIRLRAKFIFKSSIFAQVF